MTDIDDRTPFEVDRDRVEGTGKWPEGWGPFHRHFANDAIHRDGGPECDQPGTPRRVYVFDPDYLSAHEAKVAEWAAGQLTATLRARVREIYEEADADGYMDALPPLHQVMLALGAPEDWMEGGR